MDKNIDEREPSDNDILKDENSSEEFGKSELELLNLIARIIVEHVLKEEE